QLDMVTGVEREIRRGADVLEHDVVVLTAGRHPIDDQVWDGAVRGLESLFCTGLLSFGGLDVGGELFGMDEQLLSLRAASPAHLLTQRLVLGAQRVDRGDGLAPPLVSADQRVDSTLIFTTSTLRGTYPVRVLPQHFQIDHDGSA